MADETASSADKLQLDAASDGRQRWITRRFAPFLFSIYTANRRGTVFGGGIAFNIMSIISIDYIVKEHSMAPDNHEFPHKGLSLSLDGWAVIIALALALAVKFDLVKNVAW